MGQAEQLHDRNTPNNAHRPPASLPADAALLLGQLMAEIKGVGNQLTETVTALNKQTEIVHDTQLEMGRYYAGLERANDDIQLIRDNQQTILTRLDDTVSKDCLLYTSPSPRDRQKSRMPSSA